MASDPTPPGPDPTALDAAADAASRKRARIWVWALLGMVAIAIAVVSYIGREQETSVKPAPKAFCKAAKQYENDIDRYGTTYNEKVDLQIRRWEALAATAPPSVQADAELVLDTLREYAAAPNQRARDALKDDPDFEAAIVDVNRRWNQGCDVFERDSPI
ncbi:MAG: hypothetical protein FJW95_11370 [Actinobacteria bacterium]|nr:hypothetical protein [Actinomycetota bacterium]